MPGQLNLNVYGKQYSVDWGADTAPTDAEIDEISQNIIRSEGLRPPNNVNSDAGSGAGRAAGALAGNSARRTLEKTDFFRGLTDFTNFHGFESAPNPTGSRGKNAQGQEVFGGHNVGSLHYAGRAVDVRVQGKTDKQIADFVRKAEAAGIRVRDERQRPAGQEVWGGPHLHLSVTDDKVGEQLKSGTFRRMVQESKQLPTNNNTAADAAGRVQPKITSPDQFLQALNHSTGAGGGGSVTNRQRQPQQQQSTTVVDLQQLAQKAFQPQGGGNRQPQPQAGAEGTLEWAMKLIDGQAPKLASEQRATVKNFLRSVGGSRWISPEAVRYALTKLGQGDYMALVDTQTVVNHLPFYANELLAAMGDKRSVVPKRQESGGYFTVKQARELMAKAVGVPVSQLTAQKIARIVRDSEQTSPTRWAEGERESVLNPMDELYARTTGAIDDNGQYRDVSGLEMYSRIPAAAFGLLPQIAQEAAGQIMGLERGATVSNKEVQDNEVGKAGATVAGMAKYFTPASASVVAADLAGVLGRANQVGLKQATAETVRGILDSANPTAKNLSTTERVVRGVNAVLLGFGLTKGGLNAWNTGRRWQAATELGVQLGVGKKKAYNLLREGEEQARQYIQIQSRLSAETRGEMAEHVANRMSPTTQAQTAATQLTTKASSRFQIERDPKTDQVDIYMRDAQGKRLKVASAKDGVRNLEIDHLYLPEDMRGRGLGTELIIELNNYARSMGQGLRVENSVPEVGQLMDALRRRGEQVTEHPAPAPGSVREFKTNQVLPDSDLYSTFEVMPPAESLVEAGARIAEHPQFTATGKAQYPSAISGNELDDVLSVLKGDKPAALVKYNPELGPYLARARTEHNLDVRMIDGQVLVGKRRNVAQLERLLRQQQTDGGGSSSRSAEFNRARAELLGHQPLTEVGTGLRFSEVTNIDQFTADGTPLTGREVRVTDSAGTELTKFRATVVDGDLLLFQSRIVDNTGQSPVLSIESTAKGLEQLVDSAQRDGKMFVTGQSLTRTEFEALKALEARGHVIEWNPELRHDRHSAYVSTDVKNAAYGQPAAMVVGKVPANSKWVTTDVGQGWVVSQLLGGGRQQAYVRGRVRNGVLVPDVSDVESAPMSQVVRGLRDLINWAKDKGLKVESGEVSDRANQIWRQAMADERGLEVNHQTIQRPGEVAVHEYEVNMGSVRGHREQLTEPVKDWLEDVADKSNDRSSAEFDEVAVLVDQSGMEAKYKRDVLDMVSYYGLAQDTARVGRLLDAAEMVNRESLPYDVKADLIDFFAVHDDVNVQRAQLTEAVNSISRGEYPEFLSDPRTLPESRMRNRPANMNVTQTQMMRKQAAGLNAKIDDLQRQAAEFERLGTKADSNLTAEEVEYARVRSDLYKAKSELARIDPEGRARPQPATDLNRQQTTQATTSTTDGGMLPTTGDKSAAEVLQQSGGSKQDTVKGYGTRNKKFTRDSVKAAFKKSAGLNAGLTHENLEYLVQLAGYHAEASYHAVSDFVQEVRTSLAKDGAGPDLVKWVDENSRSLYNLGHALVGRRTRPAESGYNLDQTLRWLDKSGYGKQMVENLKYDGKEVSVGEAMRLAHKDSEIDKLYTAKGVSTGRSALNADHLKILNMLKTKLIEEWAGARRTRGRDRAVGVGDDGNTTRVQETLNAVKNLNKFMYPESVANERYVAETFSDLLDQMRPEHGKQRLQAADVRDLMEDFTGRSLTEAEGKKLTQMAKMLEDAYARAHQAGEQVGVSPEQLQAADYAPNLIVRQIQTMLTQTMTSDGKELLNSLWKAGLITTAKNLVQNIKGNSLNSLALSLSRPLRAMADGMLGMATGVRTREGLSVSRAQLDAVRTAVSKDLVKDMWDLFAGDPVVSDKYGFTPTSTRNSLDGVRIAGRVLGRTQDAGDWIVNRAFGYVNAIDKPFFELAFQRSILEQVRLNARRSGLKQGTAEFNTYVNKYMAEPSTGMKYKATIDAEYAIFSNKNKISEFANKAKNELKRNDSFGARLVGKGLDWLVPFLNIPTNVALRTAEFSPLGLVDAAVKTARLRGRVHQRAALKVAEVHEGLNQHAPDSTTTRQALKQFKALPEDVRTSLIRTAWTEVGLLEQRQLADQIGNSLTGTALMFLTGALLSKRGSVVINPYDVDSEENWTMTEARKRLPGALSLELGEGENQRRVDIDLSASFLGRVLALGATASAYLDGEYANEQGTTGARELTKVLGAAVGEGLQSPVGDTITRVDKILKSPLDELAKVAESTLSSAVPSGVNELSRLTADTQPVTSRFNIDDFWNSGWRSVRDKNASKLPGVRGQFPARTDALGQVIKQSYAENVFGFKTSDKASTRVADVLDSYRVRLTKPERAKKNSAKWDGNDPRYDRTEVDYQDRVAYVGLNMHQYLSTYLVSDEWNTLSPAVRRMNLPRLISALRTGYGQELDAYRAEHGWDAAHRMVRESLERQQQPQGGKNDNGK